MTSTQKPYDQKVYEEELSKLNEKYPHGRNEMTARRAAQRIFEQGMSDEEAYKQRGAALIAQSVETARRIQEENEAKEQRWNNLYGKRSFQWKF